MADIIQKCLVHGEDFVITDEDQNFYKTIVPKFQNVQFAIPIPKICPEERKRRRLSWRNLRNLYRRKCDFCRQSIITTFSSKYTSPVYCNEDWWSDKWDPLDYGMDFHFEKPFFEQFYELMKCVPAPARNALLNENCEYINGAAKCKNCYLCFNMDYCEDCLYLTDAKNCKSCVDSYGLKGCELCYESLDLENCYHVLYSSRSTTCFDSCFLQDCKRCRYCIGCVNLVDKEYHVFNKKVLPAEFRAYTALFKNRREVEKFRIEFTRFVLQFPKKFYYGHSNEDFSGNNIQHIKNSHECYDTFELENCKYCYYTFNAHNCMDYDIFGDHSQWIYNCVATGINCSNVICCYGNWNASSNNLYCYFVSGSSNNFGCIGLKQKQYCFLNKQYTRERYEDLVLRVIQHMQKIEEWGEYFPSKMSPFGYNETMAHQFLPLSKNEAFRSGYTWEDNFDSGPSIEVNDNQRIFIPENIDDVDESFISHVFICKESLKPFKIIKQEFAFYKNMGIPLPEYAPEIRHQKRYATRLQPKLYLRHCAKCHQVIQTSYSPDRPEIVYCESCYLKEVY